MAVSGKRAGEDVNSGSMKGGNHCEACQDVDITTRADGVCQECKEYMCVTCFQHHLKARQCRNHFLVDLDSTLVLDKDEMCEQHTNEIIKYFCRTHERVGCGDCMILKHGECQPELIETFSKNFEENHDYKKMVHKLESLTSTVKYLADNLKINKTTLQAQHEEALKEIRELKENIVKIFDEAEASIIGKVNHIKSEHGQLLDRFGTDLKVLSTKLDQVKQKISTENYRGKALFVRFLRYKPEIIAMEENLEQMKLNYNRNGFKFHQNKQLLDSLSSSVSFGGIEYLLRVDELKLEDYLENDERDEPEKVSYLKNGSFEINKAPRSTTRNYRKY